MSKVKKQVLNEAELNEIKGGFFGSNFDFNALGDLLANIFAFVDDIVND